MTQCLVWRERVVGCDRWLAGPAAKALPAELMAMAREGMDMIMLQECGVHELGSLAFRRLVAGYASDNEFQSHGPWSIHYDREYCTLVSHRRIRSCEASIRYIWPPEASGGDPQWDKKRRRTELHLLTGACPLSLGGRRTSETCRRGWHPCRRHH